MPADPVAELDARFSDPDATPTPWAEPRPPLRRGRAVLDLHGAGRRHPARRRGGAFHGEGGEALVFEVVPSKVLAFAKGHFAQTRYRF